MGNGIENVAKQAATEPTRDTITSIDNARQETFGSSAGFADLKAAEAAKFSGREVSSLPNLILGATPPDETPDSSGRPDGPTVEGVARDGVRAARDVSKVVRDGAELLRGILDDIQDQMPEPDDEQSEQYPQDLPSGLPGGSSKDQGSDISWPGADSGSGGGAGAGHGGGWPGDGRSGGGHGGSAGTSHESSGRDRGWSVNDGRPTPTDHAPDHAPGGQKPEKHFRIHEPSSNSGAVKPTESQMGGF